MDVCEDKEIVLEGHQIFKSFPGVTALKGVDFAVEKGEVHAIVGENGAGKSTLMKIIIGAEKLDAGELILEGKKISFSSPGEVQLHGISMVFIRTLASRIH